MTKKGVLDLEILNRIISLLGTRDQKELTDFLNLKKTAFTDWKSGKSNSYRKYLIEIAEFFNVSLDYLVYGKENQTTTLKHDEQELLDNYRQLAPNDKEKASKRVQELTTQNTSVKECKTDPLISCSNISKMNGYENRLLNAFRMLSYEEQIELAVRAETMSEKSKAEENAG